MSQQKYTVLFIPWVFFFFLCLTVLAHSAHSVELAGQSNERVALLFSNGVNRLTRPTGPLGKLLPHQMVILPLTAALIC